MCKWRDKATLPRFEKGNIKHDLPLMNITHLRTKYISDIEYLHSSLHVLICPSPRVLETLFKNQTIANARNDSMITHVFLDVLVILFAGNSSLDSLNLNS